MFERFSRKISDLTGSPYAFLAALGLILGWLLTGPAFNFSESWQLIINSATTVITFLMVFLIQHAQNLDTEAIHLKLDELILSQQNASNNVARIEKHKDQMLAVQREQQEKL